MSQVIAQGLHGRVGDSTETYVAYGGTEMLFRECARQADYRVEKGADGDAPKTAKGEDLGVGEGWWYEGRRCPQSCGTKKKLEPFAD